MTKMTKASPVLKRPKVEKSYRPPYKYAEIVWDDASSNSASWVAISDIAAPEQVITRGWLVKETDAFVSLAASVSNEDLAEEIVGNTMTIPKGMIVSRRYLKLTTIREKTQNAPEETAA
jgi:hypothetical protein